MDEEQNKQDEIKTITQEVSNFGNKIAKIIESLGETPAAKNISERLNGYLEDLKRNVEEIKENPSDELKARVVNITKKATNEMIKGLQFINEKLDTTVDKIEDKQDSESQD